MNWSLEITGAWNVCIHPQIRRRLCLVSDYKNQPEPKYPCNQIQYRGNLVSVTMDFITDLPISLGLTPLVVVDRFSKAT